VSVLLGNVQPDQRNEDEIIALLKSLHEKGDSQKSLLEKAERALILKPNFFGIGVDINNIVEMVFGKKKPAKQKGPKESSK
jgi:hypothetical protein